MRKVLGLTALSVGSLTLLYLWDRRVHQHMPCPLCGRNFPWNKPEHERKFSRHLAEDHGIPDSQQTVF